MARQRLTLPLKWHGGKYYLAPQIIARMAPHLHYCEPFFGGGAVLLAHSGEGRSEVVNDINRDLTGFWRCLQSTDSFARMARILEAVPLSRVEWQDALGRLDAADNVERAVAFFICCRQSLAGRMKSFTPPTRTRTRRGMNGNVSEWIGSVEGLADIHQRLRRVFVECLDAVVLMRREDGPGTLFYCDPPYLDETRASPDVYTHEMTADQHLEFLGAAKSCQGKVMISGYPSALYERELAGWRIASFDLPNNAAGGEGKRRMTECLWMNY